MTDAPERIWAWTSGQAAGIFDTNSHNNAQATEYIRADLYPSPEVVKELVEAARELTEAFAKSIGDRKHSGWATIRRTRAVLAKLEGEG